MRDRFHLSNSAIFAVMWVALSGLALHDISLRQHGGGTGTAASDRVVAKEFTLVDDSGVTRARIGMSDKTNAPSVQLFDAGGAQRAQLRLNQDDVPSLRLYGADGKIKSVVGFVRDDTQPSFVTFDANGVGHLENHSRPDAAFATVHDEDLSDGRYVQSYRGTVDLYCGQTVVSQPSSLELYRAQANAEVARAQAHLADQQALLQARQEMDMDCQQAELARQRAVNAAINAAADRVNIEVDPFRAK